MFVFRYIEEIAQFNSKSITLPGEGDLQFLLDCHPQYVHPV